MDRDELKIPVSEEELARIKKVAESKGLDVESWAREVLLKILGERDQGGT